MFKLFKSDKKESLNEIITEIHNEFDCAGDILLKKANDIIKGINVDSAKAIRLQNLGFKATKEVKKYLDVCVTNDLINLIEYYRMNYPFNKFITEEQVSSICTKYNLNCAPVDRYNGTVPNKNLSEIEQFRVKHEDIPMRVCKNVEFSYQYAQKDEIKELKRKYPTGIYPAPNDYSSNKMIERVNITSYDMIENQTFLICGGNGIRQ